jgi:hypothetical protein
LACGSKSIVAAKGFASATGTAAAKETPDARTTSKTRRIEDFEDLKFFLKRLGLFLKFLKNWHWKVVQIISVFKGCQFL